MKTRNLHMRLLSLVLCVCMVLSLMPAVAPVIEAEAANNVTPNYITDIGIAYAMNQSKAKSLVTNNGFTLMDKDLNEDAGGRYVYMGYKTSTDPSRAITGIIFREGENPPDSLNYGGATFYLVGGSYEGNGTGDGAVDLNVGASGAYIYTYITRDTNYDYPILWMNFYSDFPSNGIYVGGVNTSGFAENLNADAGGISIYLNYITFEHIGYIAAYSSAESMAYMRHYYLDANGITVSKISTKQLKNHLDTYTYTPSVPANITLNGYSLAFKGWSTSNGNNPSTQTTSVSYWDHTDSSNYKCFYAVYATDFKVTYDANGGTGAPAAESYTVNGKPTGSGASGSTSFVYTRISSIVPTNTNGCKYFLGWSTNKNATSAEYQPNQLYDNQGGYIQFKTNTTLYAVWQDHYDINKDGECDSCQMTMTAPPTVNGAYQISNKNQLIWFMQHVNAGNKSASAVLTADIDMGGYVWTPIASTASYHESGAAVTDSGYTGTFDGAGHVIKNFTVTGGAGDGSSGASGNVKSYGLFGTVSGTVKNLGIDSYTFNVGTADCRAGAIVGQLVTGGRIENCYVINSKVLTGSRIAGAIAGCNYGGTIDSCFAYNCEVTGHARCAAIVGDTKDDGGSKIGTVTNCYADKNPVGSQNGGSSYVMNCATLTASQFTSGEAAWKLNGNSSDGIWKQTVGSGLPGFTGGTVYQVKRCDNKTVTYSNSSVNPQAHTYSNANGLCTFCGAGNPDAVASVSRNGTVTGVYTTLNDAIQAVKDFTDDDNAVVTILKDIALGNSYQTIGSGVFTIDLNGCEISSDVGHRGVLYAGIYSANLTVIDSRGGGKITGARCGIEVLNGATVTIAGGTISGGNFSGDCGVSADGSTVEISGGSINGYYGVCATDNSIVTISGGTISARYNGVDISDGAVIISSGTITGDVSGIYADGSTVEISNGTIAGFYYGVFVNNNCTLIVSDGTITSNSYCVMSNQGTLTITGGTISGYDADINSFDSTVTLTVGEDGVGATFPGGIKVARTTLNAILGEGMAYWQGNKMIVPADDAKEITGGDVVIKAACKHTGDKTYTNNGDDHSFNCADCCNTIPEAHSYTNYVCVCGAVSPDAVASVTIGGEVSYYATLDDAIQAVTNCTAADQAVVTILKDIALGNGYQEINGGMFTFNLNGFEVSSSNSSWGVLVLRFGADVTVTDSGESGKITGACYGIEAYYSTVTISGGTITGGQSDGVRADNSTVEISGGTISGEYGGVRADNSTVEISGGTISGQYLGVHAYNSTVTISGGTISGENGGVYGYESTVIISGGTISGENCGVSVYNSTVTIIGGTITGVQSDGVFGDESTVTISGGAIIDGYCGVSVNNDCTLIVSGGTITGVQSEGVYGSESTVTIIGGTISGEGYDIYSDDCTITLSVGENGVGATFLDGMEAGGTTLNAILGEGAAYWQGNKMIVPADGATSITGGDVVIKAPCTHSGDLIDSEYYSNEFHQKSCGCGFINELEEHRFGADSVCEDCGYDKNTITITMTDDWGDSWNGNGIHVYKDGVLIGTVTLESGYTGTWSCPYDPDAEYAFYWQRGNYPEECSFEISIAGETVKKVSGKVCSRYIDGQLLYPLPLYSGWIEMDGKWYYYDPETNEPVTGIVRVPYPTEPINGITYGPNPEDVAYCESKGQTFVNKDTAWFWFNYDGSFKYNETGTWHVGIGNKSDNVFVVNGMIPWHVGMVATLGRHYYFIGDETNGANKYAVGDVYITRNTTDRDFVIGGVYTFDEYGALCEYDGITEVNGVLRYYEDARLMAGNGLTKVGDNYIYVRSNGELAVDCKYYVPGNDLGIASGLYTFDENGFMVEPVSTDKNGVYFENGAWYYYENGKIGYNKGLINVSTNWHFEDGSVMGYTAFIYVRSSGKLATGDYYITNVSNGYGLFSAGQKVNFSEDGMAAAPKNGIHEIDGSLYYFVNNRIQYNAGLMEYNGGWIYVRSNGVLATGKYWITNTNGNLDAGMYEFGADGYMVITDAKDGIVNDNGVLHYYLDGKKRYGLGLIQLPEGTYIYVRTNGELAVGSYWITNHNGLLSAGMYEFSEDGILINN